MDVYFERLIEKLLMLWVGITMYDISKPVREKQFQFHGILTGTNHDAPSLTYFYGM